jgi:hypothetical protein
MTTSKIGDARCSAIDRRRASSVWMIRAITGHGALNHAIKKVLAQKIEITAVIGFAAEGLARLFNRSAFHAENRNAPRTNADNHKNFGL